MKLSQAATILLASIVQCITTNALEAIKIENDQMEFDEKIMEEFNAEDQNAMNQILSMPDVDVLYANGNEEGSQNNMIGAGNSLRGSTNRAGAKDLDNQSLDLVSESFSVPVDNHAEDQNAMNRILSIPDEDLLHGDAKEGGIRSENGPDKATIWDDAEKFDQVEFDKMITEEFNVEDHNAMNRFLSMPGDGEDGNENDMIWNDQMEVDENTMEEFNAEDQNAMNPIMSMPDEDSLDGDGDEEVTKSDNGPDNPTIWDDAEKLDQVVFDEMIAEEFNVEDENSMDQILSMPGDGEDGSDSDISGRI
jgi:hypothetical protein